MSSIYKTQEGQRQVETSYRAFLDRWPVAKTELRLPTREGETFVIACGPEDATPVVLLHGSAFNSVTWMGDVTEWSRRFRLYAVDIIGHPGLSAPSRPAYDGDAHALWLADVLDGLGVELASFAGISLGGWLAIDFATRKPERVRSLVLLAPGGVGRELMSMAKILFVILPLMLLGKWGRDRARRLMIGPMPGAGVDGSGAEAVGAFMGLINRHFRQRLDKVTQFSDETLGRLTMPVLLIVGDQDPMIDPVETVARLCRSAPQTEVLRLPDVGHAVVGQTGPVEEFLRRTNT